MASDLDNLIALDPGLVVLATECIQSSIKLAQRSKLTSEQANQWAHALFQSQFAIDMDAKQNEPPLSLEEGLALLGQTDFGDEVELFRMPGLKHRTAEHYPDHHNKAAEIFGGDEDNDPRTQLVDPFESEIQEAELVEDRDDS